LKHDQKFFDTYFIVVGVLAALAIAILVIAMKLSDQTQGAYNRDSSEYQAAVAERLRPFGEVNLPGEEQGATAPVVADADPIAAEADPVVAEADPVVVEASTPEPVATTISGEKIYNDACLMCHGSGLAGAPIPGNAETWAPRIAQGIDVLNDHAINGYAGPLGFMPAKGARADLSDDEVRNAVEYMVAESG